MITYQIKKATTDVSVVLRIIDSTDGTPETGVVFNTAGIDMWYRREYGLSVDITEADLTTPALDDAHEDGGFLHINDGYYRLDLPDGACAAGIDGVVIGGTVTGMVVIGCYIQLVDYDPFDATDLGLTNLTGHTPQTGDSFARIGAAGVSLTEAGGDGDHLTAINLPNQTMDITGNLSGSVGSVTGAVGSVTAETTADVTKISGDATAADTLELFVEALNQVTGQIDNGSLDTTLDTYQAKVIFIDDDTGTTDLYAVVYFKNGEPVTSGITSPTIQVIKASDGTDLVAVVALTQIGALGMYKRAETVNRIVSGDGYIAKIQATIGGATRTWFQPVGRDD